MKNTTLTIAIILLSANMAHSTLEKDQETYKNGILAIEVKTQVKDSLDNSYLLGLDSLISKYKQQANLDAVKALMTEKTRFELEKTVPNTIRYCQDLQMQYNEKIMEYQTSKLKEKILFSQRYLIHLKKTLAEAMKQNNMGEAEAINKEAKTVEFIIADLTSQLPKPPYPNDAIEYRGHHYKVFKGKIKWTDAKQKCEEMGGYLVIIDNKFEENFIKTKLEGFVGCWIGVSKDNDKWELVNGQIATYMNLHPGKLFGNYVRFSGDPKEGWKATPIVDDYSKGFICEWDK